MNIDTSTEERLKRVVCSSLKITPAQYSEELSAGDIPEWDSIAHVALIMNVETEFGVAFDVIDVIDVESVGDLLELLARYSPTRGA